MGFFDRLFGKKPPVPASDPTEDGPPADPRPIEGPPEFVRAVGIQKAYWTHDAEEQARLESRPVEQLAWRERLRLHHLLCLQRLTPGPERGAAAEKCERTARLLVSADSPYRPRPALVWQGAAAGPDGPREPDIQGDFLNPSVTHIGCLEVYRVDAAGLPTGIDFVSFDDLSGVAFARPSLIRAAKLFSDGRGEVVLVPLLYGLTWAIGNEYDRGGRMTRFVEHLGGAEVRALGASGLGVGQQDFSVRNPDGGATLFGLGSVAEVAFPLDVRDPRFNEKARARGIDSDEVRRRTG